MLLFVLFHQVPLILLATLGLALYLTVIELRPLQPSRTVWLWWLLLVVLTHFIGYLACRLYVSRRSRPAS